MATSQPRIALITGATAGIGAATAARFAAAGWHLILAGRRAERLEAAKKSLGVPVHGIACDINDHAAMQQAIAAIPPAFAAVEVLVNNAGHGIGTDKKFQEADLGEMHRIVETNIQSVLTVTRALLPGMIARGRGHVVNIGSSFHRYPHPQSHVYGATKAFIENLTQSLRIEVLGTGVRVSTVEAGLVKTEFVERRFRGNQELIKQRLGGLDPLLPEDVAECIMFCVSMPQRASVSRLELLMTDQAPGFMQLVKH